MQNLAASRGGRCLSSHYVDQDDDLEWECADGHRWLAPGGQVRSSKNKPGTWCPTCARRHSAEKRSHTVEKMQRLAEELHGGRFLSDEYHGSGERHLWACTLYPGHPAFTMRPNSVRQGQWCPCCARNAKPTAVDLDTLAKTKQGNPSARCLSSTYENSTAPLAWSCGVPDHPSFLKSYRSVKYDNGWCPLCRTHRTTYTREMLAAMAEGRGGALLSSEAYRNTKQRLTWRCADGHMFVRTLGNMRGGSSGTSFCPDCSKTWGLRELYLRSLFAHLLGVTFPKSRTFSWLPRTEGVLELDGYNDELRLGFEYQGKQHYDIDGFFVRDKDELERRRAADARKVKLCADHDVNLIVVPYSVGWTHMQEYITGELTARGVPIVDPSPFDPGVVSYSRIEELQQHAAAMGGRLVSSRYRGSSEPLIWYCARLEHPAFPATPNSILSGRWCDKCADERTSARYRVSVGEVQVWANVAGGELLLSGLPSTSSEEGLALGESATFRCQRCGDERQRTVRQVKGGRLCLCASNKVRIDWKKVKAALVGRQISIVGPDDIGGGRTPLELCCEQCGHEWTKPASAVVHGDAGHKSCTRGVTIEKARAAGARSGFTLLSAEACKGSDLLQWTCAAAGHPLGLSYREMRNRRRCAQCAEAKASASLLGNGRRAPAGGAAVAPQASA